MAAFGATSLKQLIQSLSPDGAAIMIGKVTAVDDLEIQMEEDDLLIVSEEVTIVPEHLTDHEVKITADWDGSGEEKKTVTIHSGLDVGDEVYVLAVNNYKKYIVFGKVVE